MRLYPLANWHVTVAVNKSSQQQEQELPLKNWLHYTKESMPVPKCSKPALLPDSNVIDERTRVAEWEAKPRQSQARLHSSMLSSKGAIQKGLLRCCILNRYDVSSRFPWVSNSQSHMQAYMVSQWNMATPIQWPLHATPVNMPDCSG